MFELFGRFQHPQEVEFIKRCVKSAADQLAANGSAVSEDKQL